MLTFSMESYDIIILIAYFYPAIYRRPVMTKTAHNEVKSMSRELRYNESSLYIYICYWHFAILGNLRNARAIFKMQRPLWAIWIMNDQYVFFLPPCIFKPCRINYLFLTPVRACRGSFGEVPPNLGKTPPN